MAFTPVLLERFQAAWKSETEQYALRTKKAPKSSPGQGEFRWITIGAEAGADGGHHGGHHVMINSEGVMQTGAFRGKTMGEVFGKDKAKPAEQTSAPATKPTELSSSAKLAKEKEEAKQLLPVIGPREAELRGVLKSRETEARKKEAAFQPVLLQEPKQSSSDARDGLTGLAKDDYDMAKDTLRRQVGQEISVGRKALVARSLMAGLHPKAQTALARDLVDISPEAYAHIRNGDPAALRRHPADAFSKSVAEHLQAGKPEQSESPFDAKKHNALNDEERRLTRQREDEAKRMGGRRSAMVPPAITSELNAKGASKLDQIDARLAAIRKERQSISYSMRFESDVDYYALRTVKAPKSSSLQGSFMPVLLERYSDGDKWITIGGEAGQDGKKHGGHPVKLGSDGTIKAGMGGKFEGKTLAQAFGKGGDKETPKPEAKAEPPKPPANPKGFSRHLGMMSKDAVQHSSVAVGERFEHKGQMYEVTSVEKPYYHSRKSAEEMEDFDEFGVKPGWHQGYKAKPVDKNAAELKKDAEKHAKKEAESTKRLEGQAKFDAVAKAAGMEYSHSWPAGVPHPKWEEVHSDLYGSHRRGNRYFVGEVDGKKVAKATFNQYDDFRESYYFPKSITENDAVRKAESKQKKDRELGDVATKRNYEKDEAQKEVLAKQHEKLAREYFDEFGELPHQSSRTAEMTKRAIHVGISTPGYIDEAVRQEGMHGAFAIAHKQASQEEKAALNRYVATGQGEEAAKAIRQKATKLESERAQAVRELGKDLDTDRLQNALNNVRDYSHYTPESAVESEREEQESEAKKKAAKASAKAAKASSVSSPSSPRKGSTGTWAKLKSGAWGARVDGSVSKGDSITITARDGRKQSKTVGKVVHEGDGYTLVEVYAANRDEWQEIQRYAAAQASAYIPVLL